MADVVEDHETANGATTAEQQLSVAGNIVRTNLGLLFHVVDEYGLDKDGSLATSLSALRDRLVSNEIRLAVLGEFSAGKSTFIDTLLNTNVLATGILPTTSVCTSIRFGSKLQCHEVLRNGIRAKIAPEEISALSAQGSRYKEVAEISLELPSSSLEDGLIVIDTPGVNVNIAEHEAITSTAIDSANACVYLMDARQPGKKTTIDFLRKIRSKVDKLFFLLNRADILDANEQEEALEYVKDALQRECGIQNPRVELISSVPSTGAPWSRRFEAFRERLRDFMLNERDAVICAELARLLDHAIVRSEYLLESKFRLAEHELAEHYKTSIPDVERIATGMKRQIASLVEADARNAQSHFCKVHESACTDLRKTVEQCIASPFTVETLVTAVPKQISRTFDAHASQLDQCVGEVLRRIFTIRQMQVAAGIRQMFSQVRWLDQKAFFSRLGIWASLGIGALLVFGAEYIIRAQVAA